MKKPSALQRKYLEAIAASRDLAPLVASRRGYQNTTRSLVAAGWATFNPDCFHGGPPYFITDAGRAILGTP